MNMESETFIAEICRNYSSYDLDSDVLRKAMQWAYADAAKVCRDCIGFDEDDPGESAAQAIERRAK